MKGCAGAFSEKKEKKDAKCPDFSGPSVEATGSHAAVGWGTGSIPVREMERHQIWLPAFFLLLPDVPGLDSRSDFASYCARASAAKRICSVLAG